MNTDVFRGTPQPSSRGSNRFQPASRRGWEDVPDSLWMDWRWQLKNRINTLEQLESRMALTPDEKEGVALSGRKLSLGITPHFFSLIDTDDAGCPVRKQVIPTGHEGRVDPSELVDPVGEEGTSPVPGLVHRYPDRVLLLVTDRCAAYCRYCTRSRLVSGASGYDFHPQLDQAIDYLKKHEEIRDVLLSGGDPLMLSDDKLDGLLTRLRDIPHIEFIRIGSRIPVFLPQRITPELAKILGKHHPLWMSIHANHPRELTTEVREGLARLAGAGIPLGNQSVLLSGVNDDLQTMKELVHKLLLCRVRPYYLYQCDLIQGSKHLRSPVGKGLELIEGLRGHTSGYAVPQFVIDAPGGGGKVPINPEYIIFHDQERIVFRNFEGKVFEYPEPSNASGRPAYPDYAIIP